MNICKFIKTDKYKDIAIVIDISVFVQESSTPSITRNSDPSTLEQRHLLQSLFSTELISGWRYYVFYHLKKSGQITHYFSEASSLEMIFYSKTDILN